MIEIRLMKHDDLLKVVHFIAELNNKEEFHIGYCGKDPLEITEYLREEIPYTESFVIAVNNGQLIGVTGFDPDVSNNTAEIWGPFVLPDYQEIVGEIWEKVIEIIPSELTNILLFSNKKNQFVQKFASQHKFEKSGEDAILFFQRKDREHLEEVPLTELTSNYVNTFINLHDKTFPGAYYSGKQIIERLSKHNKVFIITEEELCGYIYVEADPEFGDASIEFFGVSESKRGRGIGAELLIGALKWLFSFESIESIILVVDVENSDAIRLYEKVGFILQHNMCSYKWIIDN